MTAIRMSPLVRIILLLLPLMMVGCQLGVGTQPAPTPTLPATPLPPNTPMPPATPHPLPLSTPTLEERRVQTGPKIGNNTKVLDGYLHVWYVPCPQNPSPPIIWVSPIILTDLRSGSVVYLSRNGTVNSRLKPEYKTEEGRTTMEAALKDSSIMEQVVARPQCR